MPDDKSQEFYDRGMEQAKEFEEEARAAKVVLEKAFESAKRAADMAKKAEKSVSEALKTAQHAQNLATEAQRNIDRHKGRLALSHSKAWRNHAAEEAQDGD